MTTFIIRRLLWTLLVMFVITVTVFVIFFHTPGVDPARQIAGRNPSPGGAEGDSPPVRARPPVSRAVRPDDEEDIHHP